MENNSPYVYEKPLRAKSSKRNKGFAALGLVALGSAIGTGAFANGLIAGVDPEAQKATNSVSANALQVVSGEPVAQQVSSEALSQAAEQNSIVSVPFEQTEPKKSAAAISIPAVQFQDYGNTSSATPYVGSGSNKSGAYQDGDDRYESDEEHDEDDDQDDDDQDDDDQDEDHDDDEYED